jgi:hypothetical protein
MMEEKDFNCGQPLKDMAMPRICGIELKSSEAILVVLESTKGIDTLIDTKPKKIIIGNDEDNSEVKSFFNSTVKFIRNNHIDVIVLKKRARKGKMAGGSVSFKLESLIQINGIADTMFVSGQTIAAAHKKEQFQTPESLNKYQETAFMAAAFYIRKNI